MGDSAIDVGRLRRRTFLVCLWLVVAGGIFLRLWAARQWSWFQDDWRYVELTQDMGFLDYVFQNYNGHLMPLQFAATWLITAIAPLDFGYALIVSLLLMAASAITWAALLIRIFGRRPQVILGLALLLFTPTLFPATLWWASAMQTYGLQWGMGATLLLLVAYLEDGGKLRLAGLVGVYLAALGLWEKSLLIMIPVAFVALALPGVDRAKLAVRQRLMVALALLTGVSGIYVVAYLVATATVVPGQASLGVPSVDALLGFGLGAGLGLLLPGFLGGPWTGIENLQSSFPVVPTWLQLFTGAMALAVAGASLVLRRRAWVPIAMSLTYLFVMWAVVTGSSRYSSLGQFASLDTRYSADAIPVLVLGLVYLVTATTAERSYKGISGAQAWTFPIPIAWRRGFLACVSVVAAATIVSSLYSWSVLMDRLAFWSPRPWVDTMLAAAPAQGSAVVFDSVGPPNVIVPAFFPEDARLSRMLSALDLPLRFDEPTDGLLVADSFGSLVPARVSEGVRTEPTGDRVCGYRVTSTSPTRPPLTGTLEAWNWGLTVAYLAEESGTLTIEVGAQRQVLRTVPGAHQMTSVVTSPIEDLTLTVPEGYPDVCVQAVAFGFVVPADAP